MNKNARVAIVGAGFSGLSLAQYLVRQNIQVEIFEIQNRCGGLLQTSQKKILVEGAANAMLADANVEQLFADLDISILQSGHKSKTRWIYRKGMQRFPLKIGELFNFLSNIIFQCLRGRFKILKSETVSDWTERCLGQAFAAFLVAPGLQGVYAAQSNNLAAELVLAPLFENKIKIPKNKYKGSIAPVNGMSELIVKLENFLKAQSVKINFNQSVDVLNLQKEFDAVIVASSIQAAASLLKSAAPLAAAEMAEVIMLPLVSVTLGFNESRAVKGFGCLFPVSEKLNSLGVLFNTDIFSGRGELESETWINDQIYLNDEQILKNILLDREKILNKIEKPAFIEVHRYVHALPLYGHKLLALLAGSAFIKKDKEKALAVFIDGARLSESTKPLYLTGNYLGGIGLSRILAYNKRLSERIGSELI